ncbi:MAG TPA: hypothetical protein VEK15_21605 [Vicinamibacteria bacterium]|nr:hypothetical protein [Vicinamibacteria bacterium]
MAKWVVAIEPARDPVASATYQHRRQRVYPHVGDLQIAMLDGQLAERTKIKPALQNAEVVYVTGSGHGVKRAFLDRPTNGTALLHGDHNDDFAGKIVHLLSCWAAEGLGPELRQDGCRLFVGYKGLFSFFLNNDDLEEQVLECDSLIDRSFAEGKTAAEVKALVRKCCAETVQNLEDGGHLYSASWCERNYELLVFLGSDDVKL